MPSFGLYSGRSEAVMKQLSSTLISLACNLARKEDAAGKIIEAVRRELSNNKMKQTQL